MEGVRGGNSNVEPAESKQLSKCALGGTLTLNHRFCTVPRKADYDTFADESPVPYLGNLSSHLKDHPEIKAGDDEKVSEQNEPSAHGYTAASVKLMEGFLREGKLNPKIEPTRKGFLQIFSAWLLEEDLPWTTGESPGLARLFKYLQVRFPLPSDTTVRNTLAHIFSTLHATVVEELAVIHSEYTKRSASADQICLPGS